MHKVKLAICISTFLLVGLALSMSYAIYYGNDNAPQTYQELAQFSQQGTESKPTQQLRKGILKSHVEGGDLPRRQQTITSEESIITMQPKKGLSPSNEELHKVSVNLDQWKGIESIQAGTAEFDGKELYLSDGVKATLENFIVTAQQAIFIPRKDQKGLEIEKVLLIDNVKMSSFLPSKLQYALADKVEYLPESKTWIFTAIPPKRVLYYDKLNQVTISAPHIVVQDGEGEAKPRVKATGDVRFSFAEKELNEMQKLFRREQ